MAAASNAPGATHAKPATPIFGKAAARSSPATSANPGRRRSPDCRVNSLNGGEIAHTAQAGATKKGRQGLRVVLLATSSRKHQALAGCHSPQRHGDHAEKGENSVLQ